MTGTPTNDFLATLQETLALGHDATLAMLAGAPLDPGILVPTLSAAALLATHADLAAETHVQGPLTALQTARGKQVLDAALPAEDVDALPELSPTMDYEDKVELLRQAVELGALRSHADTSLAKALQVYLENLEDHILAYGDAHMDLGPAAALLGNVAAFPIDHPVTSLLTMVRAVEYVADHITAPANVMELVQQAIAAHATPPPFWARWFNAVKQRMIQTGQDVAELLAWPTPVPNASYAAGPDDIDELRVPLAQSDVDEVNLVFQGEKVLLEWQGAGEAPNEATIEAISVIAGPETTTTIDAHQRLRWVLKVPPGDVGTALTLQFPSGRQETIAFPSV